MNKTLGILGLARKAGHLEVGEEASSAAVNLRKARVLVTASNAADNTVRKIKNYAESAKIPLFMLPYTKEELGGALGIGSCAAAALTDAGFAASLAEKLESEMPGKYTEALAALLEKAGRIEERRKEARAHERNVRTGKHASSKQKGRNTNG